MEIDHETTFDRLSLQMSKVPLQTIPWRTAKGNLVTVTLDTSVRDALDTLSRNNILSAPVFDEYNSFQGFTDYQQLLRYVVRMCKGEPKPGVFTSEYFEKSSQLRNTTLRDLINGWTQGQGFIYGEYAFPIQESASLYQAFERMAREGQHRLAVQDMNGRITGVMCQSQLIKFIYDHPTFLGKAKSVTVEELRPYSFICSINENSRALHALELMDSKKMSMNGVAITDKNGQLSDVISTHDLRGILPGTYEYNKLWSSVKAFKDSIRAKFPKTRTLPVSVKRSDSLMSVITKMAVNSVHRVFVVNSNNEPIDVISQTDILRHVLDSQADNWW